MDTPCEFWMKQEHRSEVQSLWAESVKDAEIHTCLCVQ